jgi:hypothetical protein
MSLPPGTKIKALSGKACPHCGGTDVGWSWLSWLKMVILIGTGFLAIGIVAFLPVLRRCRYCGLVFRAPLAKVF